MIGATLEPAYRLGVIDPSPHPVPVETALIRKCWGIPTFGSLPIEKQSLRIIFGDADRVLV